jgi:hypothetical protein
MYIDFSAGNKTYNLRLSTRNIVSLEKQLGCNPLMIFGKGDRVPTVTEMVQVLHASLQKYHHGISVDDAYDIFENWLDDDHIVTDFIQVIVEIYKVSGLIKSGKEEGEENEKN